MLPCELYSARVLRAVFLNIPSPDSGYPALRNIQLRFRHLQKFRPVSNFVEIFILGNAKLKPMWLVGPSPVIASTKNAPV